MGFVDRTFRLTNEPGGLGLSCSHLGLSMAGVPLLHKSDTGFAPRSPDEIEALVTAACGAKAPPPELMPSLDAGKVERSDGKISIKPHKRDFKPGLWRDLPPEKTVVIPESNDPGIVGAAAALALSHCEFCSITFPSKSPATR